MDERILVETFDKITKQYIAIRDIMKSTSKFSNDISIEIHDESREIVTNIESSDIDKKQRMIMRMKHIERYFKFITNHIQKVSLAINDVPPYNIALEILESSFDKSSNIEWDKVTEEVYNTLNIESEDEDNCEDYVDECIDECDDEIFELDPKDILDNNIPNESSSLELAIDSDNDSDDPPLEDSFSKMNGSNDSDNKESDVFEIEIDKVKYYASDEQNGKIYHILSNSLIGKKVGEINKGIATFY